MELRSGQPGEYLFDGKRVPVTVVAIFENGTAGIVFADGRVQVVDLERIRLVTP